MNIFVLKNTFIKVYIYYFFNKYFYRNNKSKLCFEDRVVILNDFFYISTEGVFLFLHEYVERQVQRMRLGGKPPHRIHGAEVHLQHMDYGAGDLRPDRLAGISPGGDVAHGHDDVHAAQRQDARRLQPDATRRTCALLVN